MTRRYEQGICETTGVERRATECDCRTYPGNLGVCDSWDVGSNGRCVYCDHEEVCHQ